MHCLLTRQCYAAATPGPTPILLTGIDLTADDSEVASEFFDADSVLRDVDAALNADSVEPLPMQLCESGQFF